MVSWIFLRGQSNPKSSDDKMENLVPGSSMVHGIILEVLVPRGKDGDKIKIDF